MEDIYSEYLNIIRDFREYLERKMKRIVPCDNSTNSAFLDELYQKIKNCKRCPLYRSRTNLVFGRGNPNAKLMFIGEAPGKDEDLQGKPFVGAAGKLFEKSLKDVGISLEDVYIANVLKCRPPRNRDPKPEEIAACFPYLQKQIQIIKPKIICTLGKFSTQTLLNTTQGISSLRGKIFSLEEGRILIPTYHPAACIYRPPLKEQFLKDLMLVKERLETDA